MSSETSKPVAQPVDLTSNALLQAIKMKRYMSAVLSRTKVRWIAVFIFALTLAVLWFYLATKHLATPQTPWYKLPAPCRLSDGELADLVSLATLMHDTLDQLQAPHALCYGTLWGALRQGRTLAWDTNLDMCALDDHLQHLSTSALRHTFRHKGGYWLDYDWTTATYNFSYRGAQGQLHVFTKIVSWQEEEVAVPGGWSRAVWRWFGQEQLTFPSWLLEAPFKEETFHGKNFPVPHDGIELLKYLYPDDWWLEVKPPGCV